MKMGELGRAVAGAFGFFRARRYVAPPAKEHAKAERVRNTPGAYGRAHVGLARGWAMEWLDDDRIAADASERAVRRRMRQLGAV